MTAIVYVDGFNLYYGALKGTAYKWLDLGKLCRTLVPEEEIVRIRYFTARVKGREHDPDAPFRQDAYLRALKLDDLVTIHYGTFLVGKPMMRLAEPEPGRPACVKVIKTEEKGTDVNIGSHILYDAFKGRCDLMVMIGNDSDLYTPLAIAKKRFGRRIGLVNPQRRASMKLQELEPEFVAPVRSHVLEACQMPEIVQGPGNTQVRKPTGWA